MVFNKRIEARPCGYTKLLGGIARNGLWSSGHPYVCIVQALVIANYKFTSSHEYH